MINFVWIQWRVRASSLNTCQSTHNEQGNKPCQVPCAHRQPAIEGNKARES